MTRIPIIFFFLLALFTFHLSEAHAAEIFFGAHNPSVGAGSIFEVGVFLKTQGESINAASAKLLFSNEVVRVKEVRDGNSVMNLWIQRPTASSEVQETGELFFSGLTPGGFVGEDGYLFSVFFEAYEKGQFSITTSEEQILLNDGQGSRALVQRAPLLLSVEEGQQSVNELLPFDDLEEPEPFVVQVARDETVFDGKWFLVFATRDKKSGISHYEVQEGANVWQRAESPYVLQDQELKGEIAVKAVDRAGNERVEILEPTNQEKWYENALVLGILFIMVVGLGFVGWRMMRRKNGK